MFVWFVATALVAMWFTFRDPVIDHRVVALGALLPGGVDLVVSLFYRANADPGTPAAITAGLAHALVTPVAILLLVMVATLGRRHARRRWLMLPIGMFWHLVFDGAWATPDLFGWPFGNAGLYELAFPLAERSLVANLAFEVVGVLGLLWLWHIWGLSNPATRARFWRSGRFEAVTGAAHRRIPR